MNVTFGPIAPVIGTLLGALIAAAVTLLFVVKRQSVRFWVTPTEDITSSLRAKYRNIVFKINNKEMFNLNRSIITVKNTGNTSIKDFYFDFVVPGDHSVYLANLISSDLKHIPLKKDMSIEWKHESSMDPVCSVSIPFLNPKEVFFMEIFFDKNTTNLDVYCRMENLKQKIKSGTYETIGHTAALVLLQTAPVAVAIAISAVIFATLHSTTAESNAVVSEFTERINTLSDQIRNTEKLVEDLKKNSPSTPPSPHP